MYVHKFNVISVVFKLKFSYLIPLILVNFSLSSFFCIPAYYLHLLLLNNSEDDF